MSGLTLFDNMLQDARFTVRQLRKSPGFTCTAIFTLALGMCASVAIFAFVDAALLKPLPYPNPSRLVGVFETVQMFPQSNLSYADYLDWKRLNKNLESLSVYQGSGMTLATTAGVQRAPGARVSDDFFRTLGVTPILGRDFRPGEDLPAAPRAVILSYAAWQSRYGGEAGVLGRTVTLNGAANVIVGVLPRDFHFAPAEPADFWTTLHPTSSCDLRRSCHNLYGVGRLKDGVSVQTAAAEMASIAQQLEKQYPDSNRGQGAAVVPLTDVIVGRIRPMLMVLLSGAGLLLIIAAVNVASLLLVRSESRRREIAVRTALGASAGRVIRQFVTEGLVLVALGSALGLAGAYWAIQFLTMLIPANIIAGMPYLHGLGPTARVGAFAGAVALLAAILFAITPLVRLPLAHSGEGLAEGSRGSAGTAWRRLGSRLVVIELATAMVLLVCAALLGQSFYRLLRVDIGLQADHLAMLGVSAPSATYSTPDKIVALEREIERRLAILPGVRSVGVSSTPPIFGGNTMWIRVVGRPYHGEHNEVQYREVSAGYFTTLQARLVRGRDFTDDDRPSKPAVVIINQAMARQYFPDENPLGKQLLYAPTTSEPPMEIVGIVDDIKEGPIDAETRPTMYVAFAQDPTNGFAVFVRTAQTEQSLLPALTSTIGQIDSGISTFNGTTMAAIIDNSQAAYLRRSSASLVGGFAAVAWLLGVVGLYGVVAYSVSRRTREIGVRMALGAERGSVHRLILREAAWLIAFGVAIGVVCSIGAATMMQGLLFGIRSYDAATLGIVAGVLAGSALVASFVPARRAASVNPMEALRAD
jgi:predicted permease